MSREKNDIVSTLRRRARTLTDDGYPEQFIRAILGAADELTVRQSVANSDPAHTENRFIQQIADNRRLRRAFGNLANEMFNLPIGQSYKKAMHNRLKAALAAVEPIGKGRALIAVEIFPTSDRTAIETQLAGAVDQAFAYMEAQLNDKTDEGKNENRFTILATVDTEAEKPAGPGHDAHQPERGEAPDRPAGAPAHDDRGPANRNGEDDAPPR